MSTENIATIENQEKPHNQTVGFRLQDVILETKTHHPTLLLLRKYTKAFLQSHPEALPRQASLEAVCQLLFSASLSQALKEAAAVLRPYKSNGDKKHTLIISSASSASASQETEMSILASRGHAIDIPGAIEGRDTLSAFSGDTAVISTLSGLAMVSSRPDINLINLAQEPVLENLRGSDIYYKSDSLLLLQLLNPQSSVLKQLDNEILKLPLIYPYNLDEETQLALLGLVKRTKVAHLDVNANSPEVAVELTRKGYKYPTIESALRLPTVPDPYQMQYLEWQQSQSAKELHYHPDLIPGYVITHEHDFTRFKDKVVSAFNLMSTRYDFTSVWIKPDRGTDGGNQQAVHFEPSIDYYQTIEKMWRQGGDWVIEAQTRFFEITFPYDGSERKILTTPSVHIIKGEPRYTVSLQLVDGVAWGGNLICSAQTWEKLIDIIPANDPRLLANPDLRDHLKHCFPDMAKSLHDYVAAVNSSAKYTSGQVRGGADLAIATLGGKFGDNLVIGVQDYNARANGCETAYALYDHAQAIFPGRGEAVTRNFTPRVDYGCLVSRLPTIIDAVNQSHNRQLSLDQVKVLSVSAGWGQIGIIGTDALANLQDILLLEQEMKRLNLII